MLRGSRKTYLTDIQGKPKSPGPSTYKPYNLLEAKKLQNIFKFT